MDIPNRGRSSRGRRGVSVEIGEEVTADSTKEKEEAVADVPAEELEDGEIDGDSDDEKEEEKEDDKEDEESDEEEVDPEERKRRKRRVKNKERKKHRKEEKRMNALQAMAMAAGDEEDDMDQDEDIMGSEEEEEEEPIPKKNKPVPLMSKNLDDIPVNLQLSPLSDRTYSPKKKKTQKRPRAPSTQSESDEEEYAKLLRKEMSRHKLKRRSSGESSAEDRRERSPITYESDGPRHQDDHHSEDEDDFDSSHRSKRKKRKKHKRHHRSSKRSSKPKSRRSTVASDNDEGGKMGAVTLSRREQLRQSFEQQQQFEQQEEQREQRQFEEQQRQELSEQDHQIMEDQEMGKRHIPKTHLICKFYLEHKCKKGLDCSYTHEGKIPKRLEQCKFYLQGFCSKGPLCMFLHQEYPCKYFHTGQICYSGEACRFSHKPLTDELKPLLDVMRSEQPPLLPSPDKHPNVPFQRGGNQGGKPQKAGKQGGMGSIPSLFDLDVKPVGEKGQQILETERLEAAEENQFERISFFGAEDEGLQKHGRHRQPPLMSDPVHMKDSSDGSMPAGQPSPSLGGSDAKSNTAMVGASPFLLPTPPTGPLIPEIPAEFQPPHPSTLLPLTFAIPPPDKDLVAKVLAKVVESSDTTSESTHPESSSNEGSAQPMPTAVTINEGNNHVPTASTKESGENSSVNNTPDPTAIPPVGVEEGTANGAIKTAPATKEVVKPPVSMPAKSKALFLRIQQNQLRTDASGDAKGDTSLEKNKGTEADDNWYSSDDEESGVKKGRGRRSMPVAPPNVEINNTAGMSEPSSVSPEASNKGPLLSSILLANNKQTEAQLGQSQLPGPLASLFSQSPSAAVKPAAPLPLNILDLVTKGSSSIQKSTNPQVQDLLAGILPKRGANEYRLLECIRDPNLTDPREGRERKSKAGMMFRVLRWKSSEYSVSGGEDRPSLAPIELTTPTEMKAQPVFPNSDPRTQAVVDALKKVIDEARAKPIDPRNQRLADPRIQQQGPRGFPPPNYVHGQLPVGPRARPMPLFSPTQQHQQPPPLVPGQPPGMGPGFMRLPMAPPNQSFPPHMPRLPQGVPTGYANPRYASRGPRGPRPLRHEFGQRMPNRPPRPLLGPPFGSPARQGLPSQERMHSPRIPIFGNTRLAEPASGEGQGDNRDPRATNRGPAAIDPRLAKRNSIMSTTPPSDVDMRVAKDPRLARMKDLIATTPAVFPAVPVVQRFPKQGDVDMRHVTTGKNLPGQPRPLLQADGFSTYNEQNSPGQSRGRLDPRQGARGPDNSKDIDLRDGCTVSAQAVPVESGIPLKDMFKGRDPTASPFL